jgi:hypothetical protein
MLGQPLIANCPAEPFDIGVLLWLTRLNAFKPDSPFLGPIPNGSADIFWSVVAANHLWLATPGNDLLQGPDHSFTRQSEVHLHPNPKN